MYDVAEGSNVTGQSAVQLCACVQEMQLIEQTVGSFVEEIIRVCEALALTNFSDPYSS
jgi:hypothetical protein